VLLLAGTRAAADAADAYDGKFASEPRFVETFRALPETEKRALARIRERLGIAPDPKQPIEITLADALEAQPPKWTRWTTSSFQVSEDDDAVRMRIHVEFIVNGRHDLQEEMTHEMTHAVQRSRMSREAYASIPKWLREGIAMWVADQTEERVRRLFTSARAWDDPVRLLPGLETGDHDLERYAEDALAFEFLLQRGGGAKAARRLVRLLEDGKGSHDAVAEVSGLAWPVFRILAQAHALERVAQMRPASWGEFEAIATTALKGDQRKTRTLAESLLKDDPPAFLAGNVLYWHGKACRILDDHGAAERSFERLLADHRRTSDYVDDGLLQVAMLEEERGRWTQAEEAYLRLLHEHPDSPHQHYAVIGLARSAIERGEKDEARRWIAAHEGSFPKLDEKERAELKART
jgi:tetratricopeptide (TPR) repeat protein